MYAGGQKDIQALDRYTMETYGLPGVVLMENAGMAVVAEVKKRFPDRKTSIIVLAGSGNNGGDGFVIARRLFDYGYDVLLCLLVERERIKGDARVHFDVYIRRQLPLFELTKASYDELRAHLDHADVIVDAILGTGARGSIREPIRTVIQAVNESGKTIVSVDIPSGVEADTGVVRDIAIIADYTVTFVMPKKGFFLSDGPKHVGNWQVADISIPASIVAELGLELPRVITDDVVQKAIPRRIPTGHKGTFGHGLIIGGSSHYVGAPLYTAKAAFRTGIGLVTLALPRSVYAAATTQTPEAIFLPLEEVDGHLANDALDAFDWHRYDALCIGPGMGRFSEGEKIVATVLSAFSDKPIIVDADALFYVKELKESLKLRKTPVILTPHPGEMATLLNRTVKEVEENRLEIAKQFALHHRVYLLLKGHRSIIATPEGELFINPVGNDALGKGGSGDVLAGVILSFLGQGATPLEALLAATYLHALAGEEKGAELSHYRVTPTDVIDGIGSLLKRLYRTKKI